MPSIHNAEMIVSLVSGVENNEYQHAEEWNWTSHIKYKNQFKMGYILLRPEIMKLLEEDIGKNASWHWSWLQNTKSTGNRNKNRQMRLHQTKKLLWSKGNNRVKKQPME